MNSLNSLLEIVLIILSYRNFGYSDNLSSIAKKARLVQNLIINALNSRNIQHYLATLFFKPCGIPPLLSWYCLHKVC